MTDSRPRPTRALLDQREQQLAETSRELRSMRIELDELRTQRDHLDARSEPEADAMALCVQALDGMRAEIAAARRRASTWGEADSSPVERVLLYLAHRYDVPLVVRAEPEPEPDGMDLVVAPSALARKLERVLRDNPMLLDQLR